MKTVTVINQSGDAFPVTGVHVLDVAGSEGHYARYLQMIVPFGNHEYIIMKTGFKYGTDWAVPAEMLSFRNRIVEGLLDDNIEVVDLRIGSSETTLPA